MATPVNLQCSACDLEAVNKYGHTVGRKQRLGCMFGKQFVLGFAQQEVENRPACPQCGHMMNLCYKKALRFRCSDYPECSVYTKIAC